MMAVKTNLCLVIIAWVFFGCMYISMPPDVGSAFNEPYLASAPEMNRPPTSVEDGVAFFEIHDLSPVDIPEVYLRIAAQELKDVSPPLPQAKDLSVVKRPKARKKKVRHVRNRLRNRTRKDRQVAYTPDSSSALRRGK